MANSSITALLAGAELLISVKACDPSLVIMNVYYTLAIEIVLSQDADQIVNDQRFGIQFSIAPVLEEEEISNVDEIRLIRSGSGYYFLTADGFNHVYVFEPASDELKLTNKIELNQDGLSRPALNQRGDHIEVIDRGAGVTYQVNEEGQIGG